MARTALAVQKFSDTGLKPTYTNANADGHAVPNEVGMFLYVVNAGGAPINVTIQTPKTERGLAVDDQVVQVVNGTTNGKFIGPFPPELFNQLPSSADAGSVYVDFSAVTSVTIAAVRMEA